MEQIEEILHETYERKRGGPREGTKGKNPIQIHVSVKPITPCATSTLEKTPSSRQPNFSGRGTTRQGSSHGSSNWGANLGRISQISTPHKGSSCGGFSRISGLGIF
jgi:hypothetical protein